MKVFSWIKNNFLLFLSLFLLAFIPLYPKLPLFDITHTWVYIRLEDFLIAFAWIVFLITLFKRKATLKTPLSVPIVVFWIIGGLATLWGVLFIFPHITGVFPHIAALNYLRRIEYLSVFFLAFSAVRNKEQINALIATLSVTLTTVFIYGIGQRLWGFPAFLTMNEEFAKGIPLRLSALARIPSTFAGHYDLAAFLILLIPVIGSMVFGYKKWYLKITFFLISAASLILLLMTASRVSFAVYLVAISAMLVLQKQKKYILPVIILSILLLRSFTGISQRFAQTFTQVDLVVDSRTGKAIGVASDIGGDNQIVIEDEQSTGENLPTGSKYINIPSAGGKQFDSQIIYKKLKPGSGEEQIITSAGKVIVKKAFAYDVSFTTRFQGEWPRAIEAFNRNILLGSGYSSINLATDNSFLRMLGETGLLGFFSFALIFIFMAIYLFKTLPHIEDKRMRSLIFGVLAGSFGLALNAILIDVYEASKVAFVLWLLVGLTVGLTHLYQKEQIHYIQELKKIFISIPALLVGLVVLGFLFFSKSLSNYFTADDFTWLRWAADCSQFLKETGLQSCSSLVPTISHFFTQSEGFFYRPGTKAYFYLAYPIFELFPTPFHVVSLLLHISATILVFFLLRKFLKQNVISFVGSVFFLVMSTHAEAVYWISVTGHMITTNLLLLAFLLYSYWKETQRHLFFVSAVVLSFFSMFFHEFGTTGPLLLIAYDILLSGKDVLKRPLKKWYYLLLLLPIVIYYFMRMSAHSVWFQGDYSYNILKLPFNVIGNAIGYLVVAVVGPVVLPYYTWMRSATSDHLIVSAVVVVLLLCLSVFLYNRYRKSLHPDSLRMVVLSMLLFFIPLLPFLGLGNLSPRYNYMSSVGVVFLLAYLLKVLLGARAKQQKLILVIVVIFSFVFILTHVKQLEKINTDWKKAGEITNSTLVGINYAYAKDGALPPQATFYFINVPIKYGDAWVFPLGVDDALWFSFQNTQLKIVNNIPEDEALKAAIQDEKSKVFKFDKNYDITELTLPVSPAAK